MVATVCAVCGAPFVAQVGAATCSSKCRVKRHRLAATERASARAAELAATIAAQLIPGAEGVVGPALAELRQLAATGTRRAA